MCSLKSQWRLARLKSCIMVLEALNDGASKLNHADEQVTKAWIVVVLGGIADGSGAIFLMVFND